MKSKLIEIHIIFFTNPINNLKLEMKNKFINFYPYLHFDEFQKL